MAHQINERVSDWSKDKVVNRWSEFDFISGRVTGRLCVVHEQQSLKSQTHNRWKWRPKMSQSMRWQRRRPLCDATPHTMDVEGVAWGVLGPPSDPPSPSIHPPAFGGAAIAVRTRYVTWRDAMTRGAIFPPFCSPYPPPAGLLSWNARSSSIGVDRSISIAFDFLMPRCLRFCEVFHLDLPGFTGFYWVLPGFTGFSQ